MISVFLLDGTATISEGALIRRNMVDDFFFKPIVKHEFGNFKVTVLKKNRYVEQST